MCGPTARYVYGALSCPILPLPLCHSIFQLLSAYARLPGTIFSFSHLTAVHCPLLSACAVQSVSASGVLVALPRLSLPSVLLQSPAYSPLLVSRMRSTLCPSPFLSGFRSIP
ncbi:hypothetical protein EXIGLDRAFT_716716 [Exidia glandulosa HHB12029]|uniref:Uncharacterized protein n=1 Tax=Exidia glandulosa HHB12029 TaxID=1314781 RepID=A0A166MUP6_EXIGL|nr:hypothetical protein EXIGLDRAFT_716716 [Exidia glandulosa HHB12029]